MIVLWTFLLLLAACLLALAGFSAKDGQRLPALRLAGIGLGLGAGALCMAGWL